jgi:hypothetical protein
MALVRDDVTSDRSGADRPGPVAPAPRPTAPTPCLAHPGSRLVHPDGRCQCFFGGPAPEFRADLPPSGNPLP